jgi:uncharacterized protein
VSLVLYGSAALIALGGAGHCITMCGGVAAILNKSPGKLITLGHTRTSQNAAAAGGRLDTTLRHGAYHAGRIFTYICLGVLAAAAGNGAASIVPTYSTQVVSRGLVALLLGITALQLLLGKNLLRHFEHFGSPIWRAVRPIGAKFIPVRTARGAWVVGMVWGYLPCGLVYSALGLALSSGSLAAGATVMLLFGLGTGPAFIAIALLARFVGRVQNPRRWSAIIGTLLAASCVVTVVQLARELRPQPARCCGARMNHEPEHSPPLSEPQ